MPSYDMPRVSDKHKITLPPPEKAPIHTDNITAWIWYFLLPYRKIIAFFIAFRTMRYTWLYMFPLVIGFMIDALESGAAQADPALYGGGLLAFMAIFAFFLINVFFIPETAAVEKASRALTLYSINHVNNLSLSWHEAQGSGGKLQRIMTGRRGFQELIRHIRWDFFPLLGTLCATIVSFFIMDIPSSYAPLYVFFITSYLFSSWFFARPYFHQFNEFNARFEKLLSGVYEFVSAIRTVKAFDLNRVILRKAGQLEEEGQEAITNAYATNLLRWTICNLIGAFWLFIFAWTGFNGALEGTISAGMFATMFFLADSIWTACETIASIWEKAYEHGNGVHRLTKMLCVKPKKLDIEPLQDIPQKWQNITFNSVNFSYTDNENEGKGQGLYNIDLTIQRGEKIAIVGPSGAGKSTFVKLLMKQILPANGSILVDNTNLNHIRSADWLNRIGFVPQDVELFNTTIRENILFENSDINETRYQTALEQAAIKDFIGALQDSDQTLIGERGIRLSGGQRQRIGIARALAKNAELIIFDEATSSLDSLSENQIQDAIENSFTGHTLVIIAHRLSTIRHVDRIIVLDEGHIVEEGSFSELVKKKDGLFAKSWTMQTEKTIS
jgi:ABC-type multidrug transport system fused ATPase/permease subunit